MRELGVEAKRPARRPNVICSDTHTLPKLPHGRSAAKSRVSADWKNEGEIAASQTRHWATQPMRSIVLVSFAICTSGALETELVSGKCVCEKMKIDMCNGFRREELEDDHRDARLSSNERRKNGDCNCRPPPRNPRVLVIVLQAHRNARNVSATPLLLCQREMKRLAICALKTYT